MDYSNFRKKTRTLVWAHRGACGYAPENTIEAFQKAIDLGADGVELDVQLTKDQVLVVIHDEKIDRTSNGTGWVKDYTYKELCDFNFNSKDKFPEYKNCKIPTLREVYELFKPTNLTINVELKTGIVFYTGIEEKVLDLTKEMNMESQVLYSSFNHYSCRKIKELQPEAYVGFLYADGPIDVASYCKSNGGDALHPALYNLQFPNYMEDSNQKGLDVNVWTVNEKEYMKYCNKMKVNAIITNYPDICLDIVKNCD